MTEQAVSPLRRRMIEDMSIRKFAGKTQHDYVQRIKEFATFLGRSPDTAKSDDVRRFRLHLTSSGAGTPKINATVAALRFFFKVTLDRADLVKHLSFIHEPRKVPAILILTDYYGGCDGGRANAKVVIRFCQSGKRRKTVIDRRRSKKRLRAPVLLMACNQRS
jgi:hypothetical protein